ncbi:OadG family protein [Propionivibrio soli]|uniref:OadG family protein n=1 Tax=Propionivibrio soli TaxID=2976531 RepID=UPI0021E8F296|nr:OadG family protein [Propionivibrio soli]
MFSLAAIKALQIYGIAIAISLFVAVLIKVLVNVTGRVEQGTKKAATPAPSAPKPESAPDIPDEVVSVITAAIATITGPHRILTIAESSRSWTREGRSALHSHQPKH